MTKRDSTIIKGIAILMMLFLHLFNEQLLEFHPELQRMPYQPLFCIGSHPLEYIMTRFCRPVPFFFILSGYGISCLHSEGRLTLRAQLRRLLSIFTAYWMTLLVFVSLGHYLGYENYPGSLSNLIANISSYSNSYNLAMWFLFPYTLICLSAPAIIKLMEYRKSYLTGLIVTGLIYGATGYMISRYISEIGYQSLTGHLLQYLQYIFPFTCGVVMHKTQILQHQKLKMLDNNKALTILLLLIVIALKSLMDSQALDTLYALAFIILLLKSGVHRYIGNILLFLGKYSMVMWMVHMYLSHYFFTDFIYGFRYSPVIFLVLVLCSLTISIAITQTNVYINKKINELTR